MQQLVSSGIATIRWRVATSGWWVGLQVSEKRSEAERETRKRERLEKESRDLKAQVDAKNDEVSVQHVCCSS